MGGETGTTAEMAAEAGKGLRFWGRILRHPLETTAKLRYSRNRRMVYRLVPMLRVGMEFYIPDMFIIRKENFLSAGRISTSMDVAFGDGGGYGLGTGFSDEGGGGWGDGWGYASMAGDGSTTTDRASNPFKESA